MKYRYYLRLKKMALFTPLHTREEAICNKQKKRPAVVVANLDVGITFLDSQHS